MFSNSNSHLMQTPETPTGNTERTNEKPKSYEETVQRAKEAGKQLEALKAQNAPAEQLEAAELEAARWLNTVTLAKAANSIGADEAKPPRYERA